MCCTLVAVAVWSSGVATLSRFFVRRSKCWQVCAAAPNLTQHRLPSLSNGARSISTCRSTAEPQVVTEVLLAICFADARFQVPGDLFLVPDLVKVLARQTCTVLLLKMYAQMIVDSVRAQCRGHASVTSSNAFVSADSPHPAPPQARAARRASAHVLCRPPMTPRRCHHPP